MILARKPLVGTVAANVLEHGCGALNIDGCRIDAGADYHELKVTQGVNSDGSGYRVAKQTQQFAPASGRWPANVTLDEEAAAMLDEQSGYMKDGVAVNRNRDGKVHGTIATGVMKKPAGPDVTFGSGGGASRFFYVAKPSRRERGVGNDHPTVKSRALMRWLARLITPPGGTVLDPFMGSGSTGLACADEGFGFIGIEREADYIAIARRRLGVECGTIETPLTPIADGEPA